jgi:hypothetical protein
MKHRVLILILAFASSAMAQTVSSTLTLSATINGKASTIVIKGQTGAVFAWLEANDPACKLYTNGAFSCAPPASGGAGVAGPAGPQGPIGPAGPQGSQGAQGITGATGPQGSAGAAGLPGAVGPVGPTGGTGAVSTSNLPSLTETATQLVAIKPLVVNTPTLPSGFMFTPTAAQLAACDALMPAPGLYFQCVSGKQSCIVESDNGQPAVCK